MDDNRPVTNKQRLVSAAVLVLGVAAVGGPAEAPADFVLTGGRIWTAEAARPWAEAVATRGGRIIYVGDAAGASRHRGPKTKLFPLGGRLVVPGFDDAHIHLMSGALSLERVDLIEDQTPGGLPTKEQLDAAVGDRPAYMECYDGHSGWANSNALALAGITKDSKDPAGGAIVRDPASGEPTGALKEAATALVESKIPLPGAEERYQLLLRALRLLNSQGMTSVQDAGYTLARLDADLPLMERALREGRLTVRLTVSVQMSQGDVDAPIARAVALAKVHRGPLLRFGAVKGYVDGVIEAHTAAMLEPYSDGQGAGKPNWEPAVLDAAVTTADRAGLQVYLHAIGDRGVRMALDAHEAALRANGRTDRRGRIEHIETISPADYTRFQALGVIASMQPLHANPDQNNAEVWSRNIGPERAARGFSWRNIEKAGGRLVFGSDWPVVTSDVMRGLYCAVARKTKDGTPPGGWLPELAVSLDSALRHYTIDGAYASFEEAEKGSLAAGKRADLVVLSQDLFPPPPEAILKTRVLLTMVDGRVVHHDPAFPAP